MTDLKTPGLGHPGQRFEIRTGAAPNPMQSSEAMLSFPPVMRSRTLPLLRWNGPAQDIPAPGDIRLYSDDGWS